MDMRGTLNQMEMEEQEFLEKLEKGQEDFYKIQELNEKLNNIKQVETGLDFFGDTPTILVKIEKGFLAEIKYRKSEEKKFALEVSVFKGLTLTTRNSKNIQKIKREFTYFSYELACSFVESLISSLATEIDTETDLVSLETLIEELEINAVEIKKFKENQWMPYEYPSFMGYRMGIFKGRTSYILENQVKDVPAFVIQYRKGKRVLYLSTKEDVFLEIDEERNMEKEELIFLLIKYIDKLAFYKEKHGIEYDVKKLFEELKFALEFCKELGSRVQAVKLESYIWNGIVHVRKVEYEHESIPKLTMEIVFEEEIKVTFSVDDYRLVSELDYYDDFSYDDSKEEFEEKMKKLKEFYVKVSHEVARVGFELSKNFLTNMYEKVFVKQNHQTSMESVAEMIKNIKMVSSKPKMTFMTKNEMYFETATCGWKVQLQEDGNMNCLVRKNEVYTKNLTMNITQNETAERIANRIAFLIFSIED